MEDLETPHEVPPPQNELRGKDKQSGLNNRRKRHRLRGKEEQGVLGGKQMQNKVKTKQRSEHRAVISMEGSADHRSPGDSASN